MLAMSKRTSVLELTSTTHLPVLAHFCFLFHLVLSYKVISFMFILKMLFRLFDCCHFLSWWALFFIMFVGFDLLILRISRKYRLWRSCLIRIGKVVIPFENSIWLLLVALVQLLAQSLLITNVFSKDLLILLYSAFIL